jgi:glycine dehydrogenase subunit 1
MIPYIPHTDEDRRRMLQSIGLQSIEELFNDIPKAIRIPKNCQSGSR